jgi:hypothetical protein
MPAPAAPACIPSSSTPSGGFNINEFFGTELITHQLGIYSTQLKELQILEEIEGLSKLKPNWDGEDAFSISWSAIDLAKEIIQWIGAKTNIEPFRWEAPFISPSPEGGVTLEWETKYIYFVVDISSKGEIEYLITFDQQKLDSGKIPQSRTFALEYIAGLVRLAFNIQ